jgi:xanthine dehydrogenase molybdenum-binding subunit
MAQMTGLNFVPPDLRAKVTGRAKYAEDFRADGMLFCRLLSSPMPHARVRNIDASAALEMEGVVAILTADELPEVPAPGNTILTNEPLYVGAPILAVAAVDETTAQNAIAAIRLDLEPLPFCVDPLESLRPGGPNARTDGNTPRGRETAAEQNTSEGVGEVKWTAEDFAAAGDGQMPMGEPDREWSYGDVEAGFANAALVLDESFVTAGHAHHSMEPRSCMSYWQNGKCYVYGSSQSQSFVVPGLAALLEIPPEDLVYIAEFCGGGFGSKGSAYPVMAIPAYMSKKTGRPVLMRISRSEESFLGVCRPAFQGRLKIGFQPDGRITAVDLYIVQDNGPNSGGGDWTAAGSAMSIVYTPPAMRFRGIPVLTNTPPKGPMRGPGQNQLANAVEPILDKAASQLGLDYVAIRRINAPDNSARYGPDQGPVTSAYQREALDMGAEQFGWEARRVRSGQRRGSKVTGVGVGQAFHGAGNNGFDGLLRIAPDGKLHVHTGVGNLGTYSYASTSRVAAEALDYEWENVEIVRGDSSRGLPWTLGQFGSNTSFTETRANYASAMDAVQKLKEIAAMDLGGSPEDYDIGNETVFSKANPSRRLTYTAAAQRAIQLGGRFSGEEVPDDINEMTVRATGMIAGTGLIGVARDNIPKNGTVPALAAGFIEIELDVETGRFEIIDYLGVADCGTVLHPLGLSGQIKGGAVMGFGMAALERHIYDTQYGLPGTVGLHQTKPPTYLDVPLEMGWDAVNIADPQNPVGAKGIGEPTMGCASAALLCAISDALGGHYFNRSPIVPDMIVNAASGQAQSYGPLAVHTP